MTTRPPTAHSASTRLKHLLRWLPPIAAAIVYWPILALPNIYDTLLHTQLAEDLNLLTVWLPNPDFGFFRPLVFLPLVMMQDVIGTPAPLLQLLNLVQHALNTWLLTLLVDRLSGRRSLALASGLLLALFPFGYQALAIYGNNAYLTVTTFILWGLVLGLTGRPSKKRMWLLAAVQLAGFLVHEIAALLLPLLFLGKWLDQNTKYEIRDTGYELRQAADNRQQTESQTISSPPKRLWSVVCRLWPPAIVWLGYLLVYLFLPRGGGPQLDYGGNALEPKILLFLQTLAHPLAWFAHRVPDLSARVVILASFGLTAVLAAWGWVRNPAQRPLLAFGFGWWLLASLLVGMTLPSYYIADGARLLYPGAAGLAMVWGVVLLPPAGSDSRSPVRWLLVGGLAFVLLSGGRFIRRMIGYYDLVSEPVGTIDSYFQQAGPDAADLVLVNFPQWVSPPRNTYATGTEFAPFLGDHLFAAEMLRANAVLDYPQTGGDASEITTLVIPELRRPTDFHVGLYTLGAVDQVPPPRPDRHREVFVTWHDTTGIRTIRTGQIWREWSGNSGAIGHVGPYAVFEIDAHCVIDRDRKTLEMALTLEAAADVLPSISLFVQAFDDQGLLAQADGPPLGLPPERLAGGVLRDQRTLDIPEGGRSPNKVFIGAYDFVTGERLPAATAAGEPLPDNAWVVEVRGGCGGVRE